MVKIERFVTDIVNGYRILIDFEFDVILEDREGSEHGAGCHASQFSTPLEIKLTFLFALPGHSNLRSYELRVHIPPLIQTQTFPSGELRGCRDIRNSPYTDRRSATLYNTDRVPIESVLKTRKHQSRNLVIWNNDCAAPKTFHKTWYYRERQCYLLLKCSIGSDKSQIARS